MLLGESASQGRVSRPPNRAFSHPPRSMSSVCGGAVIVALRRCRRSASLEAHAACCIGIPPSGGARVSFLGSRLHVILFPVARCVGGCAIQLADTRQFVICCLSPVARRVQTVHYSLGARHLSRLGRSVAGLNGFGSFRASSSRIEFSFVRFRGLWARCGGWAVCVFQRCLQLVCWDPFREEITWVLRVWDVVYVDDASFRSPLQALIAD